MADTTLSVREFRANVADVLDHAKAGDTTVVTRNGKEVAALVPIDVLRRFELYEEQAIIRMVRERMESREPGIPMEDVMAEVLADGE